MEQHLLPLPPIFADMDWDAAPGEQSHSSAEDYDYYEEGDTQAFRWPSRFCADPLWAGQPTHNGSSSAALPSLSLCFQHAVLAQLAPLLLLLCLPVLWTTLAHARRERKEVGHRKAISLPFNSLAWLRYLLTLVLFALKALLLLEVAYQWLWLDQDVPVVELLWPITHLTTLAVILHYTEQFRLEGLVVPGAIFCTWLLFVLSGLPEFLEWLFMVDNYGPGSLLFHLVQLLWWPLCCVQLLLHSFVGQIPLRPDEEPNSSPETRISFLNSQFFFWFDSLVRLGHKRPLTESDVFRLQPSIRAKRLFQRWSREWERQLDKYFRRFSARNGRALPKIKKTSFKREKSSERTPLIPSKRSSIYGSSGTRKGRDAKNKADMSASREPLPSIVACLWRLFRFEVSGAMLAKLLSDLLQFASPLLLGQLISFTEDPSIPMWWGFVLVAGLALASELRSLLMNNYFLLMNSIACQVQSVLTSAVYSKTLRLSNSARRGRTSGEIVNLMAIDVDRFQQVTPLLQQLWSSPLQVVISLFLLYQTIGWAVAGGVFVMVALIPCNLVVVRITRRWQTEQMACKDQRLRMISEVLTGIRAVKLHAWEIPMMRTIEAIRKQEIQLLRRAALLRTCSEVLNIGSPFLVSMFSFGLYIFSDPVNHQLTPQVAFVSLTLFSQLRIPMMILAELIGQLVQTAVSNRRLKQFMMADEIDPEAVQRDLNPEYERALDMEFASFSWDNSTGIRKHSRLPQGHQHSSKQAICIPNTLNNLELHIRRGLLVAVVGRVGAGKSSLLHAILGEMHKAYGYVGLRGRVAYVPQQPWILNRTVRENILFRVDESEPLDEELYTRVIDACALSADFAVLPDGDSTEIGERGINLSGGQKARVNLARALYRQADVYLLDDPLSAVDAIVGRHLFDHAVGPESLPRDSTRVLVTHSLAYLIHCDWIIVLEDGQIRRQGTYEELLAEPETAQLIARLEEEAPNAGMEEENGGEASSSNNNGHLGGDEQSQSSSSSAEEEGAEEVRQQEMVPGPPLLRQRSKRSSRGSSKPAMTPKVSAAKQLALGKLVKEETAETGRVQPSIYRDYIVAMRWPNFLGFAIFAVLQSALTIVQNFWLSSWSDDNSPLAPPGPKPSIGFRFGIFALQGTTLVLSLGLSSVFSILGSVSASIRLHGPLLNRVLHAPISFFDTTPLGRVLNRFGKEFDTVDLRLANSVRMFIFSLLQVTQVFVLICVSMPLFTLLILPILVLYLLILRFFLPTSRQLQRLTSVARSPLYNLFAEAIAGTSSIRAYGVADGFFDNFCSKLDTHIGCRYFSLISSRWLSVRLELIGNFVILFCSLLAVFSRDWGTFTAGLIGLSVSKSLDITFTLGFVVRNINDVEVSIVSVERIMEYNVCPQEAAWQSPKGQGPPPGWPHQGQISFRNFSCRYRPELDLSLRSINAEIRAREKVGVVGRTGAGKTSMALALFRIIEAAEGRIQIDGIDIARVGLQELRSRITIIPQDPVLFSGTLRFNLDPFNVYTDAELWSALENVNLKAFVESQREGLWHEIAESGENISVGQRQLLCLARAILRRSSLIVLDEATASIDAQTDNLIQRTIRTEFKQSTILTIAHRISTVLDYDRIMVLSEGHLVEFDTPANLLANKDSYFFGLVSSNMLDQQQQPQQGTETETD